MADEEVDTDVADIRHWALVAAQNDFGNQLRPPADVVLERAESYLGFLLTGKAPARTGGSTFKDVKIDGVASPHIEMLA